jgi:hypothetical protein
MSRIKALFFRERAHELADVTRGVGARLIARMLRDVGRELGLVVDDVAWLPDPGKQQSQAYVLTVTWGDRIRRQVFPREYLDGITESDVIRRRTATALKALLDAPSIWRAQGRSA